METKEMTDITIKFRMPDDREDFQSAIKGSAAMAALETIANDVFRPARKHGYPDQKIQTLVHNLDMLIEKLALPDEWPKNEFGSKMNATELIGLLEQNFYNILKEFDIDPWR
jgi:hypothetical protein